MFEKQQAQIGEKLASVILKEFSPGPDDFASEAFFEEVTKIAKKKKVLPLVKEETIKKQIPAIVEKMAAMTDVPPEEWRRIIEEAAASRRTGGFLPPIPAEGRKTLYTGDRIRAAEHAGMPAKEWEQIYAKLRHLYEPAMPQLGPQIPGAPEALFEQLRGVGQPPPWLEGAYRKALKGTPSTLSGAAPAAGAGIGALIGALLARTQKSGLRKALDKIGLGGLYEAFAPSAGVKQILTGAGVGGVTGGGLGMGVQEMLLRRAAKML